MYVYIFSQVITTKKQKQKSRNNYTETPQKRGNDKPGKRN